MNNVSLIGRLTNDPDMRYTPNGKAVTTFTLAVNRTYKNKDGSNEADFLRIVVWGKIAENVANYCKKASLVGVTGEIQTRNFDGDDGKKVYLTEIIGKSVQFLEPKKGNHSVESEPKENEDVRDTSFSSDAKNIPTVDDGDELPY